MDAVDFASDNDALVDWQLIHEKMKCDRGGQGQARDEESDTRSLTFTAFGVPESPDLRGLCGQ